MKTFFITLLTGLILMNGLQSQSIMERTYGTRYADKITSTIRLTDSSSIYFMNKSQGSLSAITIFKNNKKGIPIWAQTTAFEYNMVKSAIQTFDGNIAFAGFVPAYPDFNTQFKKALIAKMDTAGNILWTRIYKLGVSAEASKIIQLPDSSLFIIGCAVDQNEIPNYRIPAIHLDKNGNEIKTFTYFQGYNSFGNDVLFCHDSTIMIIGSDESNILIANFNLNGQLQWNKVLQLEQFSDYKITASAITSDDSNNYYITGTVFGDILCVKLNPDYEIQWSRRYGPDKGFYSISGVGIQCLNDSVIVIGGHLIDNEGWPIGKDPGDIMSVSINQHGDTLWTSCIGGGGDDFMTSICRVSDSVLCIAGSTTSFSTEGDYDGYQINFIPGKATCNIKNLHWALDTVKFVEKDSIGMGTELIADEYTLTWTADTIGFHDACICVPPVAFFDWIGMEGTIYTANLTTGANKWIWITGDSFLTIGYKATFFGDNVNICLRVENECGSDQYCEIAFGGPSASEVNQISLEAYPVPSSEKVYLQFEKPRGNLDIRIFNAAGKQIKIFQHYSQDSLTISKEDTGSGLFIVVFMLDAKVIAWRKIVFD